MAEDTKPSIRLRGMTWSDPRGYDPLVAATERFRALHPEVDIHWDKRSLQGFESTPVDELAGSYDLMIIDHPHVGAVVAENCLLPLERHAPAFALDRLASDTVGKSFQSYFYQGHQWAVPVDAATQVLALREDLLTGVPARFADVLREARAGRVVWPLRPPHVLMSYFTLVANLGAPFPVTPDEEIDTPAARQALQLMQELAQTVDPACHDMDPIAALDALAEGTRFALCPLTYLYAPYARDGYRTHRIRFHDIAAAGENGPIGSALGGTGLAVSARTAHPELCSEFALWVASADIQKGLYCAHNGQPGNARAWSDPGANEAVHGAYFDTRITHEAAWLRPRHNGYMGFQEEGSTILLDAITGRSSAGAALSALATCFKESF